MSVTLEIRVAAGADDSYYRTNGTGTPSLSNNASDVMAGRFGDTEKACGSQMRFLNVTIPKGSTIDSAYLVINCDDTKSGETVNSKLRGVDADNATMATTTGGDLGSFENPPFTTAEVAWNAIPGWTNTTDYNSPEIKTIIQEIIDRAGWASGNAIVICWDDMDNASTQSGTVIRTGTSYDNTAAKAPLLHVEYTAPAAIHNLGLLGVG